jgi:glutamine phosphoribosylpyrophosphate amidotransferase
MALHTVSLIAAVVSCVFGALSVVFTVRNIRGMRKARAALDEASAAVAAQQVALQTAVEDFVARVMSGQVVAVTTEGTVGMLVVRADGTHALRVSVEPFETGLTH